MTYEINVSRGGVHYFATHERSITTEDKLMGMIEDFGTRFLKKDGFKVSYKCRDEEGKIVRIETNINA